MLNNGKGKRWFQFLTNSKKGIRIIWLLIPVILLITIAEMLVVDPFSKLLGSLGLNEVTGVLPQSWGEAIGDSLKRIARSIFVVLSILFGVKYLLKEKMFQIGIDFRKHRAFELLLGIGLGFLVQIVSIALTSSMGWFEVVGFIWNYHSLEFFLFALIYSAIYSAEAGVIEETFFRGYLFRIYESRYSKIVAVVVTSVLFGLLHFSGFNEKFAWWMSIISSLLTGFMFAQAFLLYRSLWLPFGIHFGWHFAMRSLGSVGLSPDEGIFLVTKVNGPTMLVSTKAGGAGLFEIVGVLVIMAVMFLIQTKHRNKNNLDKLNDVN